MSCPTSELLERFLKDNLPTQEQESVVQHVDQCDRCQRKIDGMLGVDDLVPSTVASFCIQSEAYDRILNRIKALGSMEVPGKSRGSRPQPSFLAPPRRYGYLGLFDTYDVIDVIGKGGMGVVLKAHDPTLDRVVAIKVLSPELSTGEAARKRFIREARAAAAVTHENIAPIYMVSEYSGLPYLVMPVISGGSLQDRIDRTGPLPHDQIKLFTEQIAAGLAAAHARNMIHRDIKPTNLMLDDTAKRVMIVDFGLARCADDVAVTATGTIAGTPQYMAPEQAMGQRIDHRVDLYSLGTVAYAMATGHSPFPYPTTIAVIRAVCDEQPKPIHEDNPDVPKPLANIITRLMAKDPADRFQSAEEIITALNDDSTPNLTAVTGAGLIPNALPKHPKTKLYAAAVLGVLCLAGLLWLIINPANQPASTPNQDKHTLQNESPTQVKVDTPTAGHQPDTSEPVLNSLPGSTLTEASPPPTPTVPIHLPFVAIHPSNPEPQTHATLSEALASAADNTTIEINHSGELTVEPTVITQQNILIRAAKNATPTLEGIHGTLLSNQGTLTLEGITFTGPVNTMVSATGKLSVINCVFDGRQLSGDNPACIQVTSDGLVRAINSAFYSKGAAAFRFIPGSSAGVTLTNSIHAGRGTFHFVRGAPLNRRLSSTNSNLAVAVVGAFELGVTTAGSPPLILDLNHCVLDMRVLLLDASQPTGPFSTNSFRCIGGPNLISSAPVLAGAMPTRATIKNTSTVHWDWVGFAGEAVKKSPHGKIIYKGGIHPALLMAKGTGRLPTPADFEVAQVRRTSRRGRVGNMTGFKSMGANLYDIGPGQPYERFKESLAYGAWREANTND